MTGAGYHQYKMNDPRPSLFRRLAATALSAVLAALTPGLLPYRAAAQVVAGQGAAASGGAVPVVPRSGVPGAGLAPLSPAALTPGLQGALTPGFVPSPSLAPAAFQAAPAVPALPASALAAARPASAPQAFARAASASVRAETAAPALAVGETLAAAADARGQLEGAGRALEAAKAEASERGALEALFTGARRVFGALTGTNAASGTATASSPSSVAALTAAPQAASSVAVAPAAAPTAVALEGRGLQPGEKFLAAASSEKAVPPAPAPEAPKNEDWVNWHAVKWMFTQRTISTAAFILTSIAYPMVVIPAVGPVAFGALMALGPMASIALGPVNGMLAAKMTDPRKGLAMLAGLRAALAVVLPILALTGNVTFVPLLIASIANGWQFSLLMTSENAFMAKFAGRNQLPKLTTIGFTTYFSLQVLLGTLIVIGAYIDSWDPMIPFWISGAVHAGLVGLILWKIPAVKADAATLAKQAAARAEKAALSAAGRAKAFAGKASAFFKKYWKEAALFVASVGIYAYGVPLALPVIGTIAAGSPIWMSAALLYWVSRSDAFKKMWATGAVRNAILLSALSAALFYPFQNLALPLVATALGSKALIYGQLLGAFFFGQLVSNAAKAKDLPVVAGKPLEFWVRHAVVAMGMAWAAFRLFAGDPLVMAGAAAGAAALGYGLITLAKRMTDRGWIRFLGVGLAGSAGVALFWGSYPAIFASVMLMGLFLGPFVSAINGYIGKFSKNNEERAMNFGVSGSLFNAATSIGYALMTLNVSQSQNAFPAALWPIVAVFLAAGAVFYFAPRWLPGLPEKSLEGAPPAKPEAKK